MKKKITINLDANTQQEEIDLLVEILKGITEGHITHSITSKNKEGQNYGFFYQVAIIPDVDTPIDAEEFLKKLTKNQSQLNNPDVMNSLDKTIKEEPTSEWENRLPY